MRADELERIRECYSQLREVRAHHIVSRLYQKGVVNDRDKEEIEAESVNYKKMELLIYILKGKPEECDAYRAFVDALEEEEYPEVVKALNSVKTTADPKQKTNVNPREHTDEIRRILTKIYTTTSDTTKVSLHDVQQFLSKEAKFPGGFNWKKDDIIKFVCDIFDVQHKIEYQRKSKNKPVYFLNLVEKSKVQKLQPSESVEDASVSIAESYPTSESVEGASVSNAQSCPTSKCHNALKDMTPKQLEQCLLKLFKEKEIDDTELPSIFLKHKISGEVLMTMTESDIKAIAPPEDFGAIRCLILFVNTVKRETDPPKAKVFEKLRKFWTHTDHTVKYKRGFLVDTVQGVRGRKLTPRRYFCSYEITEDKVLEEMACNVIKFASVCVNERQNGTIYFGLKLCDDDNSFGQITGVQINKSRRDDFMDILDKYMTHCFHESHRETIKSTISDPEFVEVMVDDLDSSGLWVIEIDIAPSQGRLSLLTDLIVTKCKPLGIMTKQKSVYFKFCNGRIEHVELKDMRVLKDMQKDLAANILTRQEEEQANAKQPLHKQQNLRQKLLNHLTGGGETLVDKIYPFLLLSAVDYNQFIGDNFQFIQLLRPEVVFDFDPASSTEGIYHEIECNPNQAMQVLTLNNFANPSSMDFKTLASSLRTGDKIPWIFCNGYKAKEIKELSPLEWNRKQRSNFQECVKVFKYTVSISRTVIIIFLFHKNYETMLGGCDEILTLYPDQWVLFAESESLAEQWKQSMLQRKKVNKKDIENHCIVGMPIEQINSEIMRVFTCDNVHACTLPRSNGTLTEVREKKLLDWSCISLLSATDPVVEQDSIRRQVEEDYHRGCSVDWLNFYFEGQVLRRSFQDDLRNMVENALQIPEDEQMVTSIILYHQPGAGGTTSAMQVLWDLKKTYRCCVVKSINDETCDQLMEVRTYDDSSPKPLLILIDNDDIEKCYKLQYDLEEKSQRLHRQSRHDGTNTLHATLLICVRRASLPIQIPSRCISVPHKLDSKEITWFKKKNSNFIKDGIDPKYLFSFNILKNNFSTKYIESVVKEFVDDIHEESEQQLLTTVALLNNYNFKHIPISCFDHLFESKSTEMSQQRLLNWEAHLSQPTLILLNVCHNRRDRNSMGETIRLMNTRIAQSLLNYLKNLRKQNEHEIMRELIRSPGFDAETRDAKSFKDIIGIIMKMREVKEDGKKEDFSRFITKVREDQGENVAVALLIEFFQRSDDPFTAQHIARFYITMKKWKDAETFVKKAINLLSNHSFLWDTGGQVFKRQLLDMNVSRKKCASLNEEDIQKAIKLAKQATEYFKKAQSVTNQNTDKVYSVSGYFEELKSQIILLDLLATCSCFKDLSEFKLYLVDPFMSLPSLHFLAKDEVDILKGLEKNYKQTMRCLEEDYLQVKNVVNCRNMASHFDFRINETELFQLMVRFNTYFSESIPEESLPQESRLLYRFRKAVVFGVASLTQLLHVRQTNSDRLRAYSMMFSIVQESMEFDYLLAMLNVVSVLAVDRLLPKTLSFPTILDWCSKLYRSKQPSDSKRLYLEPFLYFVMYNFPTEERQL